MSRKKQEHDGRSVPQYINKICDLFGDSRSAEELIRNIFESVDEGLIIVDLKYRIILANRAYCEQLAVPPEKVIGKRCYEISHRLNRPCYENGEDCSVKHTIETGLQHSSLHIHQDSSQDPVYVEIKSYPVRNSSGNLIAVIESTNNITYKKKLEDQLRQAQKMEAVGTLAGGVAHDFNNILTAIMGYGHFLHMKMKDDDPLKTHVDSILTAAERAANLTKGLLAFSRKQIINPKAIDLNEIVRKVEKLLQRLIGEDIELKVGLAEEQMTVVVDPIQLEQVIMNLATNARDAMPDGGMLEITTRTIELDEKFLRTHEYARAGSYALLSMTDTGEGMDKKTVNRIFEPFFTTKEMGKGTGLGLAMVYGIVKQHNGFITVYSEPGIGATFKIYLPLIVSKDETTMETPGSPAPVRGTETVLVAEDDEEVRKINRDVLEEFGYAVIEAVDGEDAVRKFTERQDIIKLIIFDVVMPKKNGREALEEIRKIKPGIKSIFTSGYTADIIHRKGILEDGLDFISKPVTPQQLLLKVREALDR